MTPNVTALVGHPTYTLRSTFLNTIGETHPQKLWFNWSGLRSIMVVDLITLQNFPPWKTTLKSQISSDFPACSNPGFRSQVCPGIPETTPRERCTEQESSGALPQFHSCWNTTAYVPSFSDALLGLGSLKETHHAFLLHRSVWICCLGPLREAGAE